MNNSIMAKHSFYQNLGSDSNLHHRNYVWIYAHKFRHIKVLKISTLANISSPAYFCHYCHGIVYGVANANLVKDPQCPATNKIPTSQQGLSGRSTIMGFQDRLVLAPGLGTLSCVKGRGCDQLLLSWGLWMPIAKLSYCIYLVQYTVIIQQPDAELGGVHQPSLSTLLTGNFAFCCGWRLSWLFL